MKNQSIHSRRAFTLIELITVIAIISILMALLFTHIGPALQNARKQEALTVLKDAVNACNNYKNDYGNFPAVAAALDGTATDGVWSYGDTANGLCKVNNNVLFDILRAIPEGENAGHAMNSRRVKYIEGKKATGGKLPREGFANGSEFPSEKQGQLLDPWGAQYCLVLDADGDEMIDMGKYFSDLSAPVDRVRFSAAGFSMGKDGLRGGTGSLGKYKKAGASDTPDDVVSW